MSASDIIFRFDSRRIPSHVYSGCIASGSTSSSTSLLCPSPSGTLSLCLLAPGSTASNCTSEHWATTRIALLRSRKNARRVLIITRGYALMAHTARKTSIIAGEGENDCYLTISMTVVITAALSLALFICSDIRFCCWLLEESA